MKILLNLFCVPFLLYWTVPVKAECGGNLTATNQDSFLQSPGYPVAYPSNVSCIWDIQTENPNETVVVEVLDSELPYDSECIYASVTVLNDHVSDFSRKMGSYCGSFNPVIQSSKDKLGIVFKTSGLFVKRGFRLKFKSVAETTCNLTIPVGYYSMVLYSPGFPDHYYNNLGCFWNFVDTTGYNFSVVINSIDIEGQWPNCSNDTLTFYSGQRKNKTREAYFCNPRRLWYAGSYSWLQAVFTTNDAVVRKGFALSFKSRARTCDSTLEASYLSNTHDSPSAFPLPGQTQVSCRWTIFTYSTNIKIVVGDASDNSDDDYVTVYDGSNATQSTWLGSFTGTQEPTFISSGHFLIMEYTSSNIGPMPGLYFTYRGGTFAGCMGTKLLNVTEMFWTDVYSPNYPLNYPKKNDCSWRIDGGSSSPVSMVVISSSIEESGSCVKDYVEAFDGFDDIAPSLGKWCGKATPSKNSTGRYMFLKFHSSSNTHGLFHIRFTGLTKNSSSGVDLKVLWIVLGCMVGAVVVFSIIKAVCEYRTDKSSGERKKIIQDRDEK